MLLTGWELTLVQACVIIFLPADRLSVGYLLSVFRQDWLQNLQKNQIARYH